MSGNPTKTAEGASRIVRTSQAKASHAYYDKPQLAIWIWTATKGWGVWRSVLVFRFLFLGNWLIGRNDPAKTGVFTEGGLNEFGIASDERNYGAKKVGGILGGGFLCLAPFDFPEYFGETGIGRAETGDAWIILLNQARKRCDVQSIRKAHLDKRMGFVFFGRVELGESWTKDMGLQIFALAPG